DGLGTVLGPLYSAALKAGDLPKTTAILGSMAEKGRDHEPAKAAYNYKRPYNRLGYTTGGNCDSTFTGTGRIVKSSNGSYNGLCTNGSFPSGHSNHGYVQGTTLATLLPELAPQILLRTSEYGNNRLVLGFHYPLDVMGGRIAGQNTVQQRWSDPAFRDLLEQAQAELESVLSAACDRTGHPADVEECAQDDGSLPTDAQAAATYTERLTYGFPTTYATGRSEIVPDGAADLLLTTFPDLTDAQRAAVLKATAIGSGYALDKTHDGEASWQRIDLAAAVTAQVTFDGDGAMLVNGQPVDDEVATPTIGVGTEPVQAGSSVDVTGTGFAAGESVTVSVTSGATTVASGSATATGSGTVSASIVIPASTPAGTYQVTATGSVSGVPATADLQVTAAPPAWNPSLTAPATVHVGEAVVVTGGGFAAGEPVSVTFAGSSTTVDAGAEGAFETSFVAPDEAGTYTVHALGATSGVPATVDVVVTARPVVYTPSITAPATVEAGGPVEVSGSGFAPGEVVVLRLGAVTADVAATSTGDLTATVAAPAEPGAYVLTATGTVSATPVTARVVVAATPVVWTPAVSAPAGVRVGSLLAFSGSGFAPGEHVTITFGAFVTGVTASATGTFSVDLAVPAANGVYVVTAVGETSLTPSTSSVTVTGAPVVHDPRVSAPATVAYGSPFTVTGSGFADGESVTVSVGSTRLVVKASSTGAVSAVVRERLAVGSHTVSVRGAVSAVTRTAKVTVVKAATKVALTTSTTST
ncbi:MAG TPA: phosphatase PAP2 family protein, partial [Cellulomonas sp.]|nr:phosphatase PAP2 family protein [Cellulomonas sp.]